MCCTPVDPTAVIPITSVCSSQQNQTGEVLMTKIATKIGINNMISVLLRIMKMTIDTVVRFVCFVFCIS